MKIIILGAGQVGTSMAEILSGEENDITLVDINADHLRTLQDRLDIRTVQGSASHPGVLVLAGADDADMILAVTDSDEVNMVACQIASTMFHTPTKFARIRSAEFLSHPEIFSKESIPIDAIISPEQIITDQILRLIEHPGALQVLDFAGGKVQLVAIQAYYGGPLVGHELSDLKKHMPNVDTRVAAIYRRDRAILPEGDTVIEPDDEVFFIAARKNIRAVMRELRKLDNPVRRIMIAGAGNIGYRLASALERKSYNDISQKISYQLTSPLERQSYHVKLIERDPERARFVSEQLDETIVLSGDATDEELMLQENIESVDVFCALTNDDEANILAAMLAKRLGAHRVMALINRSAYVDLIESSVLDIAISPKIATVGSLLTHIRRGDVVAVHSLRRGAAEAIEAVAHGDASSSKVVGRTVSEIKLPPGTTIGAIQRNDEVLMAHHDTEIQSEDHVILFVVDKRHIPEVERLFQVGVTFL
ncbi:MAG: Trk system potassium transporter TrkA [Gammaproteobacteria bacterium]|nr:Trk system potassium transporter TrkA [Gammaproteobacteria bacterium]